MYLCDTHCVNERKKKSQATKRTSRIQLESFGLPTVRLLKYSAKNKIVSFTPLIILCGSGASVILIYSSTNIDLDMDTVVEVETWNISSKMFLDFRISSFSPLTYQKNRCLYSCFNKWKLFLISNSSLLILVVDVDFIFFLFEIAFLYNGTFGQRSFTILSYFTKTHRPYHDLHHFSRIHFLKKGQCCEFCIFLKSSKWSETIFLLDF